MDLGELFDASQGGNNKISTVDARMGASSPGGTKEIRLKVGFDTEAWKDQLRKEAEEASREDNLADRLQAGSSQTTTYSPSSQMTMEMRGDMMEEDDDDETGAIRRKYGVPSPGNPGPSPLSKQQTTTTNVNSNSSGGGSGKVGEKFEGSFDWGEQKFDQIQQLSSQNQALMTTLGAQQNEIQRLKEQVVANQAVSGLNVDTLKGIRNADGTDGDIDPRDLKIVELAKKNRKLNLALERERTKVRTMASDLEKAQKINAAKTSRLSKFQNGQHPGDEGKKSEKENPNKIIHQLKKKVSQLTRKNEATTTDLRKVFRVLQSEVGDDVNLQEIVQNGSDGGWRGRAEKLSMMKTKIKRLQIELENVRKIAATAATQNGGIDAQDANQQQSTIMSPSTLRQQHPNFQSNVKPESVEEQARMELQRIEQRRAETTEAIAEELDEMHQIAADQKAKLDGQKARLGTLESNARKMRGEIKVLLKKTAADDNLIDALREEIAQNRNAMATMTRQIHSLRSNEHGEASEFMALKSMTEDQAQQIKRQEHIVLSLRAELNQLTNNASSDMVVKAQKDIALHDKNTDLSLLRVENDRLSELSEMFKNKLLKCQEKYEKTNLQKKELEVRSVELERRLGNISKGGLKRSAPLDQFQALKDRLALQIEENEALKQSYRNALGSKEDEMRILRSLTDQQQKVYEKALADIRAQVKLTAGQAQARIIKTQANNDGQMMNQLQSDNEHLRSQLRELQSKFQALESQRRKRGQVPSQYPKNMREKVHAARISNHATSEVGMLGGTGSGDLYGLRAPLQ